MLMTEEQRGVSAPLDKARNVLVIDDDTAFSNHIKAALQKFGYRTEIAQTPQDGIAQLATFPADVVLLDTRIGRHDGIELIAALRECNPQILCVLVSGQSDTQSAIRALRFGAFDYLTKPVDIEILDASLDRCFDRLKLEREKAQAERALAESEARFRALVDNTPISMSIKDLDGHYLMVNKSYQEMLGQPLEDIIGKRLDAVYQDTEQVNAFAAIDRAVLGSGRPQEAQVRATGKDGTLRDLATIKFPITLGSEEVTAIGTVATDVTERKNWERALTQSEELLRSFIDNSAATMTLKAPDGRYLLANETFKRLCNHADIEGKTFFEMNGRTDAEQMSKIDRLTMESGDIQRGIDYVHYANGESWQRRFTKFPVHDSNGDLVGVGTIGDNIKYQVDAEEALRENESLLRSIIDGIPSPISLKDLDRRFVIANKSSEKLFGVPAAQIIGQTTDRLWREIDSAAINRHEQWVIDEGRARSDERTDVLPNGEVVHSIATKFPIFDSNGNVKLIGTMLTDIEERILAEEAVRSSEQQLRLIIDSLPISIGYFNADARYVLANKTSAQWNNAQPEDLIGKSIEEIRPTTYPGFEKLLEQTLDGKERRIETTATYPDGITRDIEIINVPDFDSEGRVRGFFSMAQDITARKQVERQHIEVEERFRAVIDNSPAAIVLKDTEGRYLMVNKTFRTWLRVGSETEFDGKTAHDFFSKETADKVREHERHVATHGESVIQERNSTFPDGKTRVSWSHKFPIFGPGGQCSAIGTVNMDVTEQRNLQAQLWQAQKMEAIGHLTGGVAHDFNNLLGIIVGNLDLLSEDVRDNAETYSLVEPAMKAALNATNLTRQLLAFSRKQPLAPQVIDLNQQVSDMTGMLRRSLGEAIDITMQLDEEPRPTEVDPTQFETVLLNFALNARHAMPDGGSLTIKTSKITIDESYAANHADVQPGDYTLLSVTDTGTGMTQEILDHAFDPFFTTKEVGQGSGLGLSMAFGFAKQSGGQIEIESELGVGTTVKLFLPSTVQQAQCPEPAAGKVPAACGERILVVEDDPEMLVLTVTLLKNLGYSVVEATNGVNALKVLERDHNFDLLLTDIVMPGGMNGLALAKKVQQNFPDLKIVFMSGYATDAIDIEGESEFNMHLLRKPFRVSEMAEIMREVLSA